MAASTLRALSLSVGFLLFIISEAKEFDVGNTMKGWQIPGGDDTNLNDWAEANRFQIGDDLKFDLSGGNSAMEVNQNDYATCNTANPITTYQGVKNKAFLYRSADFFFISGLKENCDKGQKLQVTVLSRRDQTPGGNNPSSGKSGTLPAPTGQTGTLPPPAGQAGTLPPPAGQAGTLPPPVAQASTVQSGSSLASTGAAMQVGSLLFTLGMLVIRLF